jgi:hypothetical protein
MLGELGEGLLEREPQLMQVKCVLDWQRVIAPVIIARLRDGFLIF